MSPVQKILKTLENSEPPFDGLCHACESQQATFSTPFRVSIMVERIVEEGGEIRPSIAGGIALKKGKSEETWEQLRFPLLLCENCQRSFERSRKWWQMKTKLKSLSMVILLLGFLVLSYFNMEAVAVLSGVFAVVGIIAFAMQHRVNSQVDTFIQRWIYNIRWIPETLETEEEFTVKVGESSPFEPVISIK
ncbi:hypothetical protein [Rubinisphaera italica]|uniref:hypothetical protein n=1 Tax=Rubinisphaera italica TaxID=2527969 RepID=UPI0011B72DD1|nr:hypothetical protein [Rubinisphaera italica]